MSSIPHEQSEDFSAWLDAFVAGKREPSGIPTSDDELRSLRSAAERFHGLSDAWSQETPFTTRSATTWEDLMTANPHAIPTRTTAPSTPPRVAARYWETANRFMSVALIVALLVGIGAGSWHLTNRDSGNPGTPPTGVPGLAQSDEATPEQMPATFPASGPFDRMTGIQSAIQRDYLRENQQPENTDVVAISIATYRFDTLVNAYLAYDLLIRNQSTSFTTQGERNGGTLSSESLNSPGDRANQIQVVENSGANYEAQQYVFVLDQTYVFAVMMVTEGAIEPDQDAINDSQAAAVNLATALVEHDDPPADEAQFNQDGTSTGGDWGFMPKAGNPILLGLVPNRDKQLFPTESGVTESSPTYSTEVKDLTGIVGAVYRAYASSDIVPPVDSEAPTRATPMADAYVSTMGSQRINVGVYELNSPQDAAAAYDQITPELVRSLSEVSPDGQQVLIVEDIQDVGDQAINARLTMTFDDGESVRKTTYQQILIQRGEYLIMIASRSEVGPVDELPAEVDGYDPIFDLATQIAAEGEPSSEEAIFAEDGTSTGGLWGFMPVTGDPLLGLVPLTDHVLYPVPTR